MPGLCQLQLSLFQPNLVRPQGRGPDKPFRFLLGSGFIFRYIHQGTARIQKKCGRQPAGDGRRHLLRMDEPGPGGSMNSEDRLTSLDVN